MAFHRKSEAVAEQPYGDLTENMVSIGLMFAADATEPRAPIEETLVLASRDGLEKYDLRVLNILTTWLGVHSRYLNADKLIRLVSQEKSNRVEAYWSSIARWQKSQVRLRKLISVYKGPKINLLEVGTEFHIGRKGVDLRFVGAPLIVPAGILRDRLADVLEPEFLAAMHRTYYWRVVMGPSYRADVWAELEREPSLSPAELARTTLCSYSTAWQVKKDWSVLASNSLKNWGCRGGGAPGTG